MSDGRVYVLGGGIAGIAAALACRAQGREVTLLEAHRWLGGRVFSVPDAKLGALRDNGPHVLLGCYDAFLALLRELGSEAAFARAPALQVAYADARGRSYALRLSRWPVPLAMPWALFRLPGMGLRAKLRALLGFVGVLVGARRDATLEQWLACWRQHGGPRQHLWDPLCLAVMNAPASEVAARSFLATLRRAFRGSAARGAIWIPDRPWQEIVGDPALRLLRARGVQVELGARVRRLELGEGRVRALHGDGFAPIDLAAADLVVSSLPWHRLAECLPADDPIAVPAARLASRPIASVYFELTEPGPLPTAPLVALIDGEPFQFLVRRPADDLRRFALLAGGTPAVARAGAAELVAAACAQLTRYFPGVRVTPEQGRAVKEARATFLAAPDTEALRPRPGRHPRYANLLLAGDWSATDLPATMEGAAVSAQLAWRA